MKTCLSLILIFLTLGCASIKKANLELEVVKAERDSCLREKLILEDKIKYSEMTIKDFSSQVSDLEIRLVEEIQKGTIKIKQYDDRIIITIDNDISFESGSATLSKEALGFLNQIGENLEEYTDNVIFVEGNTDSDKVKEGSWIQDNWELSILRSLHVVRVLERRITPKRLKIFGHGEYNPLFPNDSKENKRKNRRVDIIIIPW